MNLIEQTKPKSKPFTVCNCCNSTNYVPKLYVGINDVYYVHCPDCKLRGPQVASEEHAWNTWNYIQAAILTYQGQKDVDTLS